MRKSAFVSTVVVVLAAAGSALAQEAPAAQPAPATAQAAPAAEAPPAPPADAPAASAEASATASTDTPSGSEIAAAPGMAPTTEDEVYPPGWFRIDSDLNGLQLWVGATHDLGGLALASDAYVYSYAGGSFGEFDIGPAFTLADGALIITPMIGININWTSQKTNALVPQLYFVGGAGPAYFESWWQLFIQSPFEDTFNVGLNYLYTRNFVTFALSDHFAIGPEVDATISLDKDITGDTLMRLDPGGVVKLHYGKDNTLFAFAGYETQDVGKALAVPVGSGDRAFIGRLSFVKNW
jgi:hypothetical protein